VILFFTIEFSTIITIYNRQKYFINATLKHITKVYPFQELKFFYADSKTPEAVVLPYDDFLGLMETLLIINDKKLMSPIKRGLRDVKEGNLLLRSEIFD